MSFDGAGRSLWISGVPYFHFLVISNCSKYKLIEIVPCHVFNYGAVSCVERQKRLLRDLIWVCSIDIPDACLAVIWSRQEKSFLNRVPGKAIALLSVANEPQIWLYFIIHWSLRVLEVIENVNFSAGCFSSNNFLILRHISSFVHFALVIYLNVNWNTGLLFFSYTGAANSVRVVVQNILFIVPSILGRFKWDFHLKKSKILVDLLRQFEGNFAHRWRYAFRSASFESYGQSHKA